MKLSLAFIIGALIGGMQWVGACGDDHDHTHLIKRAVPQVPLTPPSRPLQWGDLNIIHTTDSHGWLLGHQKSSFPEPNYSGDFGDFASFERDVDLLLVDSGDLHDGTGLSDGFPPGGVDAHESNKFFEQLPYDVLAIGNHELYVYANTFDMYTNFAPKFPGRYLSSNVNITVFDDNDKPASVPVGSRFAKFKTSKGRRVTSLGVLFDFTGNDVNTTVQKVEDMVKEQWFAEAIKEEPDLFLLVGHMPVSRDNWPTVFNAVRAVHPTTPILILGGHTHIRDCLQFDGRSMALESGRYMETVGWMSVNLNENNAHSNLTFSRRYLDPNRVTYEASEAITKGLNQIAENFDLSFMFGIAPQDYTLTRDPYPSNGSLLSLFIEQATPVALAVNNSRASIPNIIISNSGGLRFDLYSGNFTKNDQLTSSPFTDAYLYIPDVPFSVANQVLPTLNNAGANERKRALDEVFTKREEEAYRRGEVGMIYRRWLEEMDRRSGEEKRSAGNLTLGYVTQDSCPGVGDDILHSPLPFYSTPDFIGSATANVTGDTPIDLVFIDFIEDQLLEVLNGLQNTTTYTDADVKSYSTLLSDEVLGVFAQEKWN